jgi:hypothetical protein
MKIYSVVTIALVMSVAGYGKNPRLAADNSDYGGGNTACTSSTTPDTCILSPGITAQDFFWSGNSDSNVTYQFFDLLINTDITNFSLTVTGGSGLTFAPDDSSGIIPFYGFGAFACDTGTVPCSDGGADGLATTSLTSSDGTENSVTFNVPGDGKGLVFFIVQNEGSTIDPTVTATVTPLATPEPNSLPILAAAFFALVAVVALNRRRLANLR